MGSTPSTALQSNRAPPRLSGSEIYDRAIAVLVDGLENSAVEVLHLGQGQRTISIRVARVLQAARGQTYFAAWDTAQTVNC